MRTQAQTSIVGDTTRFAVRRDDGRFDVGNLINPTQTKVEDYAPAGAKLLERTTFERVNTSADSIRKAVLGEPNPVVGLLRGMHFAPSPVHRAVELMDAARDRLGAWQQAGRPDSLSDPRYRLPAKLENLRDSVNTLGDFVSTPKFKRAFLDASPEERATLTNRIGPLFGALDGVDGVISYQGELQGLVAGLEGINSFLFDTGSRDAVEVTINPVKETDRLETRANAFFTYEANVTSVISRVSLRPVKIDAP